MPARPILILCATALLPGCSAATAAGVDPNNDTHCAAMAVGFLIVAEREGAPADQKRAISFVDQWYGRKLFEAGKTRPRDSIMAEAQVAVDAMETDPLALKDAFMSCTERAIEDAGLNK